MSIPQAAHRWRLRAAAPDDESFLRTLFAESDTTLQALPPELRSALLEMQYQGRHRTYMSLFPGAIDSIILHEDGSTIGRQLVHRDAGYVRLVDVALLERWRRRGIGSELLGSLLNECRQSGDRIGLRVVKANPAISLYQRLGFNVFAEDEVSYEMTWIPHRQDAATSEGER